ncbi:universal stress protein [Solidesulfovibrio sp.]|uniref:universal stress protein n=1 Tax=Solidesulfovibrio sp. TaxID=2910990 RepID=UPI002637117D|nr:universal stress protein [Solidesulfovibrio sp.]
MERILVGMTPRHGAFAALTRALSLAKRIGAKVHVLYVTEGPEDNTRATPPLAAADDRGRVRLMVERAQEEGVGVECFVTEGDFEEEVIRFARDRRITLLVSESADGEGRASEREAQSLRRILHGVSCRVELVTPRREPNETQTKGEAT